MCFTCGYTRQHAVVLGHNCVEIAVDPASSASLFALLELRALRREREELSQHDSHASSEQ